MNNDIANSELNRLIPPEIKNDEFYTAIQELATKENIKTVLEIGSSSGEGSTEALVRGLRENPNKPILFCMEISQTRFAELKKRYANDSFVKCYNLSSVSLQYFSNENEVNDFYKTTQTNLNCYPLNRVLGWLQQDIEYVKNSGVPDKGIRKIKQENNIFVFDFVVIDGSEFTGGAEFDEIYEAKIICLDDINTFKNYKNHQKLLIDKKYMLLAQNNYIRNGYSIFKKIDEIENYFAVYEKAEQLLVSKLVRPGMVAFDIGANVGNYSILLSKLVGSYGKVYSFEPASSTFNQLQERLNQSGYLNVYAFKQAIYSDNKQIEFNEFPEEYSAWNSIGRPQMLNTQNYREYVPIVNTEIVEAITLDSFCKANEIRTINYLKLDVEGAKSDALQGAIQLLTNKAIHFLQFEISQKMLEGLNHEAKHTFEALIKNGYECHRITENGDIGEKVITSDSFYENYIAFPSLTIHFLTIVLNGEPFIRYHIEVFKQLPFKWHWHIVEGVAELKHDTAWSLQMGGHITDKLHRHGRSHDGTTEYLDELAALYPDNITVYRKAEGVFWNGKREMVNEPLFNINEECLLWQVDADELWTVEQLCTGRQMFINNPEKTAAFYWCWYFVGENLVVSTRNCYAQNPQQEWLRTWKYKPGAVWVAHEPPSLAEPMPNGQWRDVAAVNPFLHEETERLGLIFQHFAYVTPEQLRFKEQYYGYTNATSQWLELKIQTQFPVLLGQYFPWVQDATQVDTANSCGVVPIAQREGSSEVWRFLQLELPRQPIMIKKSSPTIIVDGVFFQINRTGIARVWSSLLEEWVTNGFAKHIIVLDRAGTAPKISGLRYRPVQPYDYGSTDADREMLQQVCDQEEADLFISTYYTTPISTPSIFMAYDMTPEVVEPNLNYHTWREKHYGIKHASAYITISENTARDLVKFFPNISSESITVAHCGVKRPFSPATYEEISKFKTKYCISKPYFILVGVKSGYKNSILFFKAFHQLYSKHGFEIVCTGICTGSGSLLEAEFRTYTSGNVVHMLQLSDDEMAVAYSGAVALVYPSKYEGFGLPVLEALACGCPVITCPNSSIPEVAGQAALYVNDENVDGLTAALCDVQKPEVRNSLIAAGLEQAKNFSWSSMARKVSFALINATLLPLNLNNINLIIFPDWSQPEESLCLDLEKVIRAIVTLSKSSQITLLVDTGDISGDDAALILSSVNMNLLMQEDLEFPEGLEISLVCHLDAIQWQILLPRIHNRIVLENENKEAIALIKAENIPACDLGILSYEQAIQSEREIFKFDLTRIPQWLLDDYLKVMLAPSYFHEIGEADKYYQYMEQCVNYLHSSIFSNPESSFLKKVAAIFTTKANFIPLYFNKSDLKDIYTKRADIIEFFLKSNDHQIDYSFSENALDQKKIRIGILAAHFAPQTETFATLPVYKHLNRDLFEIILYPIRWSNHRLERHCSGHADAVVNLPEDLPSQVQTIRDGDLDILFISTNVTAVTYSITLLALHRLARVQMVGMNSPVTTGMRHVDYYISSKLIKSENDAKHHYTEKLITLDSPAQCFDFATEEQLVVTNTSSRESLGVDKKSIIYISGANFYKIIPELQVAWAKIIKGVANSKLVLYPFNPNWSNSYPIDTFRDHLTATFARQGLSEDRLIVLEPVPNRADVQERLKLGDIYLDSYPYSGMTSLIDPLQLGLPTVAMEGNSSRSRMGASLLRELQIPDLISDSEESYIQLAIALGIDSELRKQKSDQIKRRMRANPGFLDSRSYSAQMGTLFQELFRKHQALVLTNSLKLRAINLIIFPDWSQLEDVLYQDLASVITKLVNHHDKNKMTLLINTGNLSEDEANLFLSDIVMNLLLKEDLDVADGPEISLVGHLGEMQWEALLPQIQARIVLEKDQPAMSIAGITTCTAVKVENIPVLMIDGIIHKENSDDTTKASY